MNQAAKAPTRIPDDRLAEVVRRLVAAVSPRAIYLFGSHACGSPGPDSDIDLYITLEDDRLERDDCDELAYGSLRGLFLPIELHIQSEQAFQRRGVVVGTLEHDVRSKGKLLYAA